MYIIDDELRALFAAQEQCVLHDRWAEFDELSTKIDEHLARASRVRAKSEERSTTGE